jgi:hypothetical protein
VAQPAQPEGGPFSSNVEVEKSSKEREEKKKREEEGNRKHPVPVVPPVPPPNPETLRTCGDCANLGTSGCPKEKPELIRPEATFASSCPAFKPKEGP